MSGLNYPPFVALRRNSKFIDIECERGGMTVRLGMDLVVAEAFARDILDELSKVPVEADAADFTCALKAQS